MKISGLIISILLSTYCYAQISTDEYLLGAAEELGVLTYQEQLNYLNDKPYKLAPLRRVQFRTENDQLAEEQQEYALRIHPSNPWLVKRNNTLFESQKSILDLEANIAYKEELVKRYEDIIDYCFQKKEVELDSALLAYLKQEHEVLITITSDRNFNTDRLVDVKIESLEQLLKLEETQSQWLNTTNKIRSSINTELAISWTYDDLINPDSMKYMIDQLSNSADYSVELDLQQRKIELVKNEIAIEKSIDNLGFIQTDYNPWRNNGNFFGVSLGITVPIFNPNKADVAERNLELMEEQSELELDKRKLNAEKQNLVMNFNNTHDRYQKFKNEISTLLSQETLDAYLKQKDQNPLKVLKIRSTKTKLDTKLLKYELELYKLYIQTLASFDVLQQLPFKNHLSSN
ncbi:MAG: TolC family protein [bacterium]|nr:TolC family protein [bacterium]